MQEKEIFQDLSLYNNNVHQLDAFMGQAKVLGFKSKLEYLDLYFNLKYWARNLTPTALWGLLPINYL